MPKRSYRRSSRSYKRRRASVSSDNLAIAKLLTKREAQDRRARALINAHEVLGNTISSPATLDSWADVRTGLGKSYIRGRGAYTLGNFMRDAEPYADRFLKKGIPNIVRAAGQAMPLYGMLTGRGAYNNLVVGGHPSMDISSPNDETQSLCITHTEFLQDVYGPASSQFSLQTINLNPGLLESFPWLSQIAANYEEYEFIQLLFHFKSTVDASATNNSNGSTGTIIMATNYNPTAPPFQNKETMMQYHGSISGRVTDDHTHGVECDPSKNAGTGQKYVRFLPSQPNQDLKTFDLGTFQLAQVNLPTTFFDQQIGELWVTYSVKLTKPRLVTSVLSNGSEWRCVSNGGQDPMKPLGTDILYMQQNSMDISVTNAAGDIVIQFPDFLTGVFDVQLLLESDGSNNLGISAGSSLTFSTTGNVQEYSDLLAVNGGGGNNPSSLFFTYNASNSAIGVANAIALMRVSVTPVTAGDNNTLTLETASWIESDGVINQSQLIIRMTNNALSQSAILDVPAYINSQGIQTLPY